MELSWNDRHTRQFLTNVGLITTDGHYGPNVMAAEWTHHVSYSPSLIAINVRGDDATAENINQSKVFGVNLAAEDQNILCSLGGRYTGKELDKIALFKELGIILYLLLLPSTIFRQRYFAHGDLILIQTSKSKKHLQLRQPTERCYIYFSPIY